MPGHVDPPALLLQSGSLHRPLVHLPDRLPGHVTIKRLVASAPAGKVLLNLAERPIENVDSLVSGNSKSELLRRHGITNIASLYRTAVKPVVYLTVLGQI